MIKDRSPNGLIAWYARAESASLQMPVTEVRAAKRVFETLPLEQKIELTLEMAQARRREMTRGYTNVVAMTSGMRRKTVRGKVRLTRQPCVIFFVRRKWRRGQLDPTHREYLPAYLFTHITVEGRRQMCAVPTDVQLAHLIARGRAQQAGAVSVTSPNGSTEGCITCLITVGGKAYVLAPMHILSPIPRLSDPPIERDDALAVQPTRASDGPVLVVSTKFGGSLHREPQISFDAQLAAISDETALKAALAGLVLSATKPMVTSFADIASLSDSGALFVLVPDNHRDFANVARHGLRAQYAGVVPEQATLKYEAFVGGRAQEEDVCHRALAQLEFTGASHTVGGDSGSPVVALSDDGAIFVGMHIAGNEKAKLSFVIPAWQLLSRLSYDKLPSGPIVLSSV